MSPIATQILGVLGSIGGLAGLGMLFTVRVQTKKLLSQSKDIDADAAAKLSAASQSLLEPAKREVEWLEKKLTQAREQIDALQVEVSSLRGQVSTMTKDLADSHDEIRRLTGE